tara:strand:- start:621 stop:2312 length:1692 start_codon:yes stop_codon:yes gene_type:complete
MIGDALEIQGENPNRVRSYRTASRRIEASNVNVMQSVLDGDIGNIPGVGKTIAEIIKEFTLTGSSSQLSDARDSLPDGIFDLLKLQGLGPKTVGRLYRELNIDGIDTLEQAALSGRIRELSGMGVKRERRIVSEITLFRQRAGCYLLGDAYPAATALVDSFIGNTDIQRIGIAGAIRRGESTVRKVELVASTYSPAEDCSRSLNNKISLKSISKNLLSGQLNNGLPVQIHLCQPRAYAANLLWHTGSKNHVDRLRQIATSRDMILDPEGLRHKSDGQTTTDNDEAAIYKCLGMPFIPAELRENQGEIEAALENRLPALINLSDIVGELHTHSDWSDGSDTLQDMISAAIRENLEYYVVSDHSHSLQIANGLDVVRLMEQRSEVNKIAMQTKGLSVLHGSETDILKNGELDFEDDILQQLDWVTASIHTSFSQSRTKQTERMIRAVRNPFVDSIGHPTGRILNQREAYDIDITQVINAAIETGTAMELNAMPDRLDLPDTHARIAVDQGAKLVINTDAHSARHLSLLYYGVITARRAWVTKEHVLNCMSLDELTDWRKSRIANS